jgi:hypothetical protein
MTNKKLSISKQVISITDMAVMCNLSRARFYQLLQSGFFPKPLKDERSKRPYYNLKLQQQCLECRQSGIGVDGSFMLFYSPRKKDNQKRISKTTKLQILKCKEFAETLESMGLDCSEKDVSIALSELYPEGTEGQDQGVVIRDLYRHLKQMT